MIKLSEKTKIGFIFRVKFKDGRIRSYSFLQTFDKTILFNDLYKVLEGYLEVRNNEYQDEIIIEIIFSYFIFSDKSSPKNKIKKIEDTKALSSINKKDKINQHKYFKIFGFNFPVTSDFSQWGTIIVEKDNYLMIAKKGSHLTYHINKFEDRNEIVLKIDSFDLIKFGISLH